MSFWFDLRIICETIKVVFFGQELRDAESAEVAADASEQLGTAA
jgi:hypothetical protein